MNNEVGKRREGTLVQLQTGCMCCGEQHIIVTSRVAGECPFCGHRLRFDSRCRVVDDNEVFINLTPDPVRIKFPKGAVAVVRPFGTVARAKMSVKPANPISLTVPTVTQETESIEGLIGSGWQTKIVSAEMMKYCVGRDDVVTPDTGSSAIRDEDGNLIAVTRFIRPGRI